MATCRLLLALLAFIWPSFAGLVEATSFTFVNHCGSTVWPGILSGSGSAPLQTTGFGLASGETRTLSAPTGWSGRFWGRTGCSFDLSGHGTCATGDCGSGTVECNGAGAAPPATLVEFTLDGSGGKDYYDVSLVDGYNLPIVVDVSLQSQAKTSTMSDNSNGYSCMSTGCVADLNQRCPQELKAADGAACRSACEAFGTPEYCCKGDYANPDTCKPSTYSQVFKSACPRSYSYAYDDATSTFTCIGADYLITFCPVSTPNSQKSSKNPSPRPSDAMLEDDAWLASLATGEATSIIGKMSVWSARSSASLAIAALVLFLLMH